jgi:hypothetical protein
MTLTPADIADTAFVDPARTKCACGRSAVLPKLPSIHCVKCHDTYISRTLGYPAYCAHCGYNLRSWRVRNNIPEPEIHFR